MKMIKKNYLILIIAFLIIAGVGGGIYWKKYQFAKGRTNPNNQSNTQTAKPEIADSLQSPNPNLDYPIADFSSRITKKPFGIYITSATSPIQPERFTGYHTGADIEYTDTTADIPVYAITHATVEYVGNVSGYGGVLILAAKINNEPVTILYGHLRLASIKLRRKEQVSKGQELGVLGTGYSTETDGERHHLHFAIHKGANLDFKGYVQNQADLSGWIDPATIYKT